jgi:hypothetical protein
VDITNTILTTLVWAGTDPEEDTVEVETEEGPTADNKV